jgi:hypothetical protein
METLADDICVSLNTLKSLVETNVLSSSGAAFAACRKCLHTNVSKILSHENENEKVMAALRIYERCGASIDVLVQTPTIAVFFTQIHLTTTLRECMQSARLTSSISETTSAAAVCDETFFTTVVRCIGTGNDINDVHEFRKLMARIVSLCGSWVLDELCIDISKFKETMYPHRLERVYKQMPHVVRAISHWHTHSAKSNQPLDELLFTMVPRHFIEEETPTVYSNDETRARIHDMCAAITSYVSTLDGLIQTLGSIMQRFRMEIRTSVLDETLRNSQWSMMSKDQCRLVLDAFERSFSSFGQVHSSTIGYKTKFKEIVHMPFQRNKVWFESERDQLSIHAFVCFLCMFIESTYFASHDHDRWLYNVPLSKTDQQANDHTLKMILLDPASITISMRKNAAKRSTKKKHMINDLQTFASNLAACVPDDPDPCNPYFWGTTMLSRFATHAPRWVDVPESSSHDWFWHTPPYHPPDVLFPRLNRPSDEPSIAHGYSLLMNGKQESLTIEPVDTTTLDRDDVPESFLWRPQNVVYSFAKEESQLRERDYAHIGRTSAFATVCEVCAKPDHAFTRVSFDESPLAFYCRSVLQGCPQIPFQPYSSGAYNPFLPTLAASYMSTIEEARKHHLDYALNMYCLRAWLQYYSILNSLVVCGNDGRYLYPFSVRMLVPDMDASGRAHSMIRTSGKPIEWIALTLTYASSEERRDASHRLAHSLSLSLEDHERVSISMGATNTTLVIGFPSSELNGCGVTSGDVTILADGTMKRNDAIVHASSLTQSVLRLARPFVAKACLSRVPDVMKTYLVFSSEVSRGVPNLFEFTMMSLLLSYTHDPAHGLAACCPGGMASIPESQRTCMIPIDNASSPLYDAPFFSCDTAKGRVFTLDATMPLWNALVKKAFTSAEVQLTHTYALPLHNTPTAHALFPDSQLRSRLVGMVFRAMISIYTFNPIVITNEDPSHKLTENIVIKLDKTEIVFTHDVRAKSVQAGAAHNRAKNRADGPVASRTGSKQSTDAFYISSPYMTFEPLLKLSSIQRADGSIDTARLERFTTAFGYTPPGVSHLDVAERDSPVFVFGHVQYARVCLASSGFMRFAYSKRDGKGRSMHFSGFRGVRTLDSRGTHGAFVAELKCRILPSASASHERGVALFIPRFSTAFDPTRFDRYARIFAPRNATIQAPGWVETRTFVNGEWRLFERRTSNHITNDSDTVSSLEAALYWLTKSDSSSWMAISAGAYVARFVAKSPVDYNATMRAHAQTVCTPSTCTTHDFDATYKSTTLANVNSVCRAMLERMMETMQDEQTPEGMRRDAERLARTDVCELIMTLSLSDVMAFLTRVALMQCVCNILRQPEYESGVLVHMHSNIFEDMLIQINTIGSIVAPHDSRASFESPLVALLNRGADASVSTLYFTWSVRNEQRLGVEFQRILRCIYSCATLEHASVSRASSVCTSNKRKALDPDPMTEARRVACKESLKTLVGCGVSKPYALKLPVDEPAFRALEASSHFRMSELTVDGVNAFRALLWTRTTGGTLNVPKKTLHAKLVTKPLFAYIDIDDSDRSVGSVSCWFERAREHNEGTLERRAFDVHYCSSRRNEIFNKDETFEWDVFVFSSPTGVLFERDVVETDAKCSFEYDVRDEESIGYTACIDTIAHPVVVEEPGGPRRRFYCAHVMSSVNSDRSKSTLRNTYDNTAHFAIIVVEDSKIIQIQHQVCVGVKN